MDVLSSSLSPVPLLANSLPWNRGGLGGGRTFALQEPPPSPPLSGVGNSYHTSSNESALETAAQDFEAVFIAQMLRPLFSGIKTDPPFGGGQGEEVFRSLMIEEYGKSIASRGGLGLADTIKAEMIKMQGGQENLSTQQNL